MNQFPQILFPQNNFYPQFISAQCKNTFSRQIISEIQSIPQIDQFLNLEKKQTDNFWFENDDLIDEKMKRFEPEVISEFQGDKDWKDIYSGLFIKPSQELNQLPSEMVQQKKRKKYKPYPEKNISRYITRHVIRQMIQGREFHELTIELCMKENLQFENLKEYFLKKLELFTNLKILAEHWDFQKSNENLELRKIKKVFTQFYQWFLDEKATRYILQGTKKKNQQLYLNYKNKVLQYYIKCPNKFKCNRRL